MALLLPDDGRIASVNAMAAEIAGWAPEKAAGKTFAELCWMSADDNERIVHALQKDRRLAPREIPCRTKSGKPLEFIYRGEILHSEHGDLIFLVGEDNTEHKREQQAFRQSEDRYRKLVEISPDAIAVHVNGIVRYVNDATLRLHGAESKEQLLGVPALNFVHPDSRELVRRRFATMWDSQRGVPRTEEKFLRFDGSAFDVEVTATPLSFEGERAVLVVFRDITDRKRAEHVIRMPGMLAEYSMTHSPEELIERALDETVEVTSSSIGFFHRPGVPPLSLPMTIWSSHARDLWGTAGGRVLKDAMERTEAWSECIHSSLPISYDGRPEALDEMIPPESRALLRNMLVVPVNRGGQVVSLVGVANTREKYAENDSAILVHLADTVWGINEHMQVEKAIHRSEALYRTLFETAYDAIMILNNGVFIDCNPATLKMFDCAREQIVGKTPPELSPAVQPGNRDSNDLALEKMRIALMGESQFFEWVHRRPDGSTFDAEVSLNRVDTGTEVVLQAIVRDVTGRKKSEENLRTALHEKEVLLKEIHHRVKNNMQVISSLLSLQANEAVEATTREGLIDTRNRVRSMALVHEKLYRSGTVGTIDFGEYLKSVVSELARSYQKENIEQDVEADQVPLEIDVAIPCGLIANEIVSNAFKHAFPGGRPGKIHVMLRDSGEHEVELRIHDDGVGIPVTKDPTTMASMGMKIVYALADQIAAHVALERENGTTFTIRFRSGKG